MRSFFLFRPTFAPRLTLQPFPPSTDSNHFLRSTYSCAAAVDILIALALVLILARTQTNFKDTGQSVTLSLSLFPSSHSRPRLLSDLVRTL